MSSERKTVLVICGPTASGKTDLAVAAARLLDGEIVSADSMQIYRCMDIGTAKPTPQERGGVPHHLIDIVAPDEPFSVADWQQAAKEQIQKILAKEHVPVVAGGTGLYINSLVHNLQFSSASADETFRARMTRLAQAQGVEAVHALLAEADPDSASRIHPNNLVRVIRTLEVVRQTGETMDKHHLRSRAEPAPWRFVIVGLMPERAVLYDRINRRVDQMVADGLADEVRGLLTSGFSRELQSMQGIGYKELAAWISGECEWDAALEQIRQGSRQYAKRQITWFSRLEGLVWLDPLKLGREASLMEIRNRLESPHAIG